MAQGQGNPHPRLENLKVITSSEMARDYQSRMVESRKLTREKMVDFKVTAKVLSAYMKDLPVTSALDVMRLAMHDALQKGNFEDAAKYASLVAEYEQPKLARLESTVTNRTEDLSDEELKKIVQEEGLMGTQPVASLTPSEPSQQ